MQIAACMKVEHVPVLIVGAGGAGLSLSLLLLQQGIHPMLIERRPDVSWHPRARNLNFRTLEVLRGLGLSEEIRRAGARVSRIFARAHLASQEQRLLLDPSSLLDTGALSPEPFLWYCSQSRLEPILLRDARQRGADVRYGTELVDFAQDAVGITATVLGRSAGTSQLVRAEFLIGADGAHSSVRDRLHIPTQGRGTLDEHYVFIYVRAALGELVRGHEADAFMIEHPNVRGMFLLAENDLGIFALTEGTGTEVPTREQAEDLVKKAIGRDDIAIDVLEIAPWRPEQRLAERFQQGRVLLVGDAAHTMPPKEGLGVNTAIQSAQNLAWKLAAVLKGHAPPDLLSTYQTERYPVAWFAAEHSMTGPGAAILDNQAMKRKASEFFPIVGYRYRSPSIVFDENSSRPPNEIALLDREELTGIQGTRVPHVWLRRASQRISTLDLLDGRFVLLIGRDGGQWCDAAMRVASDAGIALAAYRIGPDGDLSDPDDVWTQRMGISTNGAVLIRPDGFVAWRGIHAATSPETLLDQVLRHVLCFATTPSAHSG
jgi:putative polyketide hydroxylase